MPISAKSVFLDIDGTLIDSMAKMPESTKVALEAATANGHQLYLCTGRSRIEIFGWLLHLGFSGVISAAGGYVEDHGELLFAHTFSRQATVDVSRYFGSHGIEFFWQTYDTLQPSPGMHDRFAALVAERFGGPIAGSKWEIHPLLSRFTRPGVLVRSDAGKAFFMTGGGATLDDVSSHFAGAYDVVSGSVPIFGSSAGELMLKGVNKGSAIAELAAAKGVPLEDTIGIGDSPNDLEMLEACGVGIAMGNASDAVKLAADEVTTSIHDDGIYRAFERNGLI